jgi:hypothetical protein
MRKLQISPLRLSENTSRFQKEEVASQVDGILGFIPIP